MTEAERREKARQERNRYYREYRAKNKEREGGESIAENANN